MKRSTQDSLYRKRTVKRIGNSMTRAIVLSQERGYYGGQLKILITSYNKRLYWPQKWIKCDCGEFAQQVYERKYEFMYPTDSYEWKTCQRSYQLITGTNRFF